MQVELAHEHGAGVVELASDEGVALGHAIAEEVRAGGGRNAGGIDDVLQRHGDTVQGAAVAAGAKLLVGAGRLLADEVGREGDVGVDRGLGRGGAGEDGIGEGGRGKGSIAQGGGGFSDREVVRLGHGQPDAGRGGRKLEAG